MQIGNLLSFIKDSHKYPKLKVEFLNATTMFGFFWLPDDIAQNSWRFVPFKFAYEVANIRIINKDAIEKYSIKINCDYIQRIFGLDHSENIGKIYQ